MKMKYCSHCGQELPQESNFCPYCMNSLSEQKTVQTESTQIETNNSKKKLLVIIICAFIVILAVGIVAFFTITGSMDSSKNTPSNKSQAVASVEENTPNLAGTWESLVEADNMTAIFQLVFAADGTVEYRAGVYLAEWVSSYSGFYTIEGDQLTLSLSGLNNENPIRSTMKMTVEGSTLMLVYSQGDLLVDTFTEKEPIVFHLTESSSEKENTYVGKWAGSTSESYDSNSGNFLTITACTDDSVSFSLMAVSAAPSNRIAEINLENCVRKGDVVEFSYSDDGWGNSGSGHLNFKKGQIDVYVATNKHAEDAMWDLDMDDTFYRAE